MNRRGFLRAALATVALAYCPSARASLEVQEERHALSAFAEFWEETAPYYMKGPEEFLREAREASRILPKLLRRRKHA